MPVKRSVQLRSPEIVMQLSRMGSFHQTRLSFMRGLLRRIRAEKWRFSRPVWKMDDKGVGVGVYRVATPDRVYSLVAFSHDLDPAKRSDRSIATEWDATFTMFDGIPDSADLERLSHEVPKQEAGRVTKSELSISRANRSVRLFDHVVDSLARGLQPDRTEIESVGYLMRTTAVYGSAKFGAAARDEIKFRNELSRPFQIEMLSVYLIRAFTVDIVEHLARVRAPETAVRLGPSIRRRLGVGNSTGLGMAPFLVTHPILLHKWISAREEALRRVRSVAYASAATIGEFRRCLERAAADVALWRSGDTRQAARINELRQDLMLLGDHVSANALDCLFPWDELYRWGEDEMSLEGQELLVSLLIEPHGELVDDLCDEMSADEDEGFQIDGTMNLRELREALAQRYGWALDVDFGKAESTSRFWYVSENKMEPRLGDRIEEPEADKLEQPLDIARAVSRLESASRAYAGDTTLAVFLLERPEHRQIVRRVLRLAPYPYSEIRENLIAKDILPIDMLRCKLSFFGAAAFDPRSDRWVRINMYKNAPFPDEINEPSIENGNHP